MTVYVGLLRAVNVGGTGKLPMTALRTMCEAAGFTDVRTYIASGNVVFAAEASEKVVKAALEHALEDYAGRPVGVVVRSAPELAAVLAGNPFKHAPPDRTIAIFLDEPPPSDGPESATGRHNEEIALGRREVYVHYPSGQGRSKLKLAAAQNGTARNMNTVAKLAAMAAD
jgi:uncharacterized protein (DUF1697 family)